MYRKIKSKIKSIGVKNTLVFMASRLYKGISNSSYLFFRCNLLNYDPYSKLLNQEIEIAEKKSFKDFTPSEKMTLQEYGGIKLLSTFEYNLAKGYRLFLAYINKEAAGACWVYVGGARRFYVVPLSEGEFMCFSNFTIDRFRRRGVSTALFTEILKMMKREGFQQGFVFTKEWNFNQEAILKAGFQFVGRFHEFRLLKKNILIWSSVNDRSID